MRYQRPDTVIALSTYAVLIYLIFGKLKLLPWNGTWKSIVALNGLIIALVVIGALNNLTPSGRVTVQGATIEIRRMFRVMRLTWPSRPDSIQQRGVVSADRVSPPPTSLEYKKATRSGEASNSDFIVSGKWKGYAPPPLPAD